MEAERGISPIHDRDVRGRTLVQASSSSWLLEPSLALFSPDL